MKKTIALFISLLVFAMLATSVGAADYGDVMEITSYHFFAFENTGTSLRVQFSDMEIDVDYDWICAIYDTDGTMAAVQIYECSAEDFWNSATFDFPNVPFGDYDFKVFMFESGGAIRPICNSAYASTFRHSGLVIPSNQIVAGEYDGDDFVLTYRENIGDEFTREVKIDKNSEIYRNGTKQYSYFSIIGRLTFRVGEINFYGVLELRKSDSGSDVYDSVHITDYQTMIVAKNDTLTKRLIPHGDDGYGFVLRYAVLDGSILSALYDKNGKRMNWEDLKEDDVVSYIRNNDSSLSSTLLRGYVVDNIIKGTVTETDSESCCIDGVRYGFDRDIDYNEIKQGDEGTFYLDILGNITYFLKTTMCGYVASIDIIDEDDVTMKIFTTKGEMATYNVAKAASIDGVRVGIKDMIGTDNGLYLNDIPLVDALDGGPLFYEHGYDHYVYTDYDITAIKALQQNELIRYEVNGDGEISAIDRAFVTLSSTSNRKNFIQYGDELETATYSIGYSYRDGNTGTESGVIRDTNKFSVYFPYFADNSLFIGVSSNDDGFIVHDKEYFKSGDTLSNVRFYNVDSYKYSGVTIYNADKFIPQEPPEPIAPLFISSGNGMTGYMDGEPTEITLVSGVAFDAIQGMVYDVEFNADNQVERIEQLGDWNDGCVVELTEAARAETNNVDSNIRYSAGQVTDVQNRWIRFDIYDSGWPETYSVDYYTNIYVYDWRRGGDPKVTVLDRLPQTYEKEYYELWSDGEYNYFSNVGVFVRTHGYEVRDVVFYIFE